MKLADNQSAFSHNMYSYHGLIQKLEENIVTSDLRRSISVNP